EEPPSRSLFLVISHAPGRLLATIRSRCRRLDLRSLDGNDVARAAATAIAADPNDPQVCAAAAASDGNVARALTLLGGPALALRQRVTALLAALPAIDTRALHALGEMLGRADDAALTTFVDAVSDWLSARLHTDPREPRRLARVAEVWEKVHCAAQEVEVF